MKEESFASKVWEALKSPFRDKKVLVGLGVLAAGAALEAYLGSRSDTAPSAKVGGLADGPNGSKVWLTGLAYSIDVADSAEAESVIGDYYDIFR